VGERKKQDAESHEETIRGKRLVARKMVLTRGVESPDASISLLAEAFKPKSVALAY
jgi:hypothetical protein